MAAGAAVDALQPSDIHIHDTGKPSKEVPLYRDAKEWHVIFRGITSNPAVVDFKVKSFTDWVLQSLSGTNGFQDTFTNG